MNAGELQDFARRRRRPCAHDRRRTTAPEPDVPARACARTLGRRYRLRAVGRHDGARRSRGRRAGPRDRRRGRGRGADPPPEARHAVQSAGLGAARAAQRHAVRPDGAAPARALEGFPQGARQDGSRLRTAAQFLFVPRGGPWPLEEVHGDKAGRDGSETSNKENIQYHYDLSNAFYALFLDPEMVYSCAHFTEPHNDIARAQRDKLDMICRKLRLKPDESFLDIGCGWGALVFHAAQHYGVRAHGVTLAEGAIRLRQGEDRAARAAGPRHHRAEGLFAARRHLRQDRLDRHVRACRPRQPRALFHDHEPAAEARRPLSASRHRAPAKAQRPRVLPQAQRRSRAIGRYIFPGGELDHLGMSIANLERHGFEVHDVEAWREHYARTTRLWHDRLLANYAAAEREVGAVKTRMWLIYLAGVSIGFDRAPDRHLPDAGVEAPARRLRRAAVARGSLSIISRNRRRGCASDRRSRGSSWR